MVTPEYSSMLGVSLDGLEEQATEFLKEITKRMKDKARGERLKAKTKNRKEGYDC